jgi:hypothetical protein
MLQALRAFWETLAKPMNRCWTQSVTRVDLEYVARKERTAKTRLKLSGMPQAKHLEILTSPGSKAAFPVPV